MAFSKLTIIHKETLANMPVENSNRKLMFYIKKSFYIYRHITYDAYTEYNLHAKATTN